MCDSFVKYRLSFPKRFVPIIILFLLLSPLPEKDYALAQKIEKINVPHVILTDYNGVRLSHPSRLFYDPFRRETYVVDSGNNRILIYTYDFFPLMSIDKTDGIECPIGLTLDSEGNLFVGQSATRKHPNGKLSVLNASLKWERDVVFEGFEGADKFIPRNIAFNKNGLLYVTGRDYHGVVVLDKGSEFSHILTIVDSFGGKSIKVKICDVEIDDSGNIYLLSEEVSRVYVYDAQENFLLKFGQKGGGTGKLSRPRGLAVDNHNKRVYVVDYMRHSVSAYSLKGKFLFEFGGLGWSKGWLQFPSDICTDIEGNILVADTFNNRVQVFKIKTTPPVAKIEKARPKVPPAKKKQARKPVKHYILTANMNLREKSNTKSKVIQLMKKGEEFQILDQYKHDDKTYWYSIKTSTGITGWFCGIYRGKTRFVEKQSGKTRFVEKQSG